MGSLAWAPCVSCEYWVRDPYIFDRVAVTGFGALCSWCSDHFAEGNEPLTAWWQNSSLRALCSTTLAISDVLLSEFCDSTVALGIAACVVDEQDPNSQVSLACYRTAFAEKLDILTPVADGLPRWGNWGYVDYGKKKEGWHEIYVVCVVNAVGKRIIYATHDGQLFLGDFTVRRGGKV